MRDFVDGSAFNFEQGQRARKLFAAVVLAALDDAIADDKKYGNGPEQIARWARSRDGREVLSCAGIDPNERVVKGLMEFVSKGVRTSVALSREESERRHAAEEADDELLVNSLSMLLPLGVEEKQALLESPTLSDRREMLDGLLEFALRGGDDEETIQ